MKRKVPYHCSFLLDSNEKILRLAIAWRRVGNTDFGLYLASDPAPSAVYFAAVYNPRGEILSFLVSDDGVCAGEPWGEDHIAFGSGSGPVLVDGSQAETLTDLAESFYADWLESYASSDTDRLLKKMGIPGSEQRGFLSLMSSELPIQVRPEKMPDLLVDAVLTEKNFLYSFMPQSADAGASMENRELLEAKMRMFLELV